LRRVFQVRQQFGLQVALQPLGQRHGDERLLLRIGEQGLAVRQIIGSQALAEDVLQERREAVATGPVVRALVPRGQGLLLRRGPAVVQQTQAVEVVNLLHTIVAAQEQRVHELGDDHVSQRAGQTEVGE